MLATFLLLGCSFLVLKLKLSFGGGTVPSDAFVHLYLASEICQQRPLESLLLLVAVMLRSVQIDE